MLMMIFMMISRCSDVQIWMLRLCRACAEAFSKADRESGDLPGVIKSGGTWPITPTVSRLLQLMTLSPSSSSTRWRTCLLRRSSSPSLGSTPARRTEVGSSSPPLPTSPQDLPHDSPPDPPLLLLPLLSSANPKPPGTRTHLR